MTFRYAGHAVFVILLCVLVTCALPVPGMASAGGHVFRSLRSERGVSLIQADTQTVGVDLPGLGVTGFGSVRATHRNSSTPALQTLDFVPLCRILRC